jgi:hypothetical protein
LCGWLCAPVVLLGLHAEVLQKLAYKGKVGIARKVFSRQTNLLHLIKENLKDFPGVGIGHQWNFHTK